MVTNLMKCSKMRPRLGSSSNWDSICSLFYRYGRLTHWTSIQAHKQQPHFPMACHTRNKFVAKADLQEPDLHCLLVILYAWLMFPADIWSKLVVRAQSHAFLSCKDLHPFAMMTSCWHGSLYKKIKNKKIANPVPRWPASESIAVTRLLELHNIVVSKIYMHNNLANILNQVCVNHCSEQHYLSL